MSSSSHLLQMRGLKLNHKQPVSRHNWSHLLQMRGLKQKQERPKQRLLRSHLLQMRGLKQYGDVKKLTPLQSHLLQMRGLKPGDVTRWHFGGVASFTDAWIETDETRDTYRTVLRRIFYRCVD